MAESVDKERQQGTKSPATSNLDVADDVRLRYIGFDVGPKKIRDLFRSEKEQQEYLTHVQEKRQRNDILRDTSNFREERISGAERYTLLGASLIVLISFFLPITPWISGYFETRTEITVGGPAQATGGAPAAGDSSVVEGDSATGAANTAPESVTPAPEKTGFQELQVSRKRTKIDRVPFKLSGAQILARIGELSSAVFSSGIALKLTGVLFLVFILLIFAVPLYIIYSVLTIKGDPDTVALKLKKALKYGWYPVMLWVVILLLSFVGADYGFDTAGALNQIGESYGAGTFLGLLGSGFYISLAGCILAGSKSAEI